MRRAERLFRIVGLFRDKRVRTASELAAALEVCERTIYRDIAHLQASGVNIEGIGGMGYVADERLDLPPLNFNTAELEALALGLSFVTSAGDSHLVAAAASARSKIDSTAPAAARDFMDRNAPISSRRVSGRAPEFAAKVRRAIQEQRVLVFAYRNQSGATTSRRLRPMTLTAFTDCWVVSGWCEARRALRNFRLDRMSEVELLEVRFVQDAELPNFA
ncbi:helix-turn-helix transcriptional regulator [Roseinatronobacter alkalisoli]|uniref:YafY family protein n=1 Tax=Roseinatronobacter alkalisoli TaxID=3028235 RepID=A0ABT5TGV8_9RHOB|nr:YafY family protein [Roseinatronobacter sp. HJB301]MDD7973925.1 YafY family protein [Roseinatronobacter sp. HJB301]